MRLLLLVLAAVPFLASPAQDPVAHAEMLKQAQQFARVHEPHQRLQRLAGTWDVVLRTTPPGGAAHEDRGTVTGKTMLGGRYVVLNFQLQLREQAMEAVQILGFDNLRQVYTASWRDDLSTWSIECRGAADAKTPDVLRLAGTLADARDAAGRPFRLEMRFSGQDKVEVSIHDTHDGAEFLFQRQEWTRR